jgi:hypothetical protein
MTPKQTSGGVRQDVRFGLGADSATYTRLVTFWAGLIFAPGLTDMAIDTPPHWLLGDLRPHNSSEHGPSVSMSIATGMPIAIMSAEHAQALGEKLIEAARIAKGLPVAD